MIDPITFGIDMRISSDRKLLLDRGANVNSQEELRRTPLHLPAFGGHAERRVG
jgi:hypothetical protein